MSEVFVTELPIRWGDIDAARVVYFPKMVNLVHVAMEDFFTIGLDRPYPKMIRTLLKMYFHVKIQLIGFYPPSLLSGGQFFNDTPRSHF